MKQTPTSWRNNPTSLKFYNPIHHHHHHNTTAKYNKFKLCFNILFTLERKINSWMNRITELRSRSMFLNLLLELVLLCAHNLVDFLPFLPQHESRHRLHLKLLRHILFPKKIIQNRIKKVQNHSRKQKLESIKKN